MQRRILIILCILAFVYLAKVIFGIVGLARYQSIPVLLACIGLALHVGAAFFPLRFALGYSLPKRWHYAVWAPCILYEIGISINFLIRTAFAAGGSPPIGCLRLLGWLAIAILFIRESRKMAHDQAARP